MTTTVTVNSGGGADFTTIQAAIDDSDVSTEDYIVEVQNNAAYAENLTMGGSTGTPTIANYLHLTATDGAYHGGVIETGSRVSPTGADHSIEVTEDFARISKILVELSTGSSNSNECIRVNGATDVLVERCILDAQARNRTTTDGDCFYNQNDADTPLTLYNTVMIDADRGWVDLFNYDGTINLEFCTGYRCAITETNGGQRQGYMYPRGGATTAVANIYNTVGGFNGYAEVNGKGASQTIFHSEDADATVNGANNAADNDLAFNDISATGFVANIVHADAWTDPTNFDLTILDTDSDLYLAGTDRSGSLPDSRCDATVDIAGVTRPATPSIGAYEFVAAGADRTVTAAQTAFLATQAAPIKVIDKVAAAQTAFLATQAAVLSAGVTATITAAQTAFLATQAAPLKVLAKVTSAQTAFLASQAAPLKVIDKITAAQTAFLATQNAPLKVIDKVTAAQTAFLATQAAPLKAIDKIVAAQTGFLASQAAPVKVIDKITSAQTAFLASQTSPVKVVDKVNAAQTAFLATQSANISASDVGTITAAQTAFLATQAADLSLIVKATAAQSAFLATQAADAILVGKVTAANTAFLATQAASAKTIVNVASAQSGFLATQAASAKAIVKTTAAQSAFLATQLAPINVVSEGFTANNIGFLATQSAAAKLIVKTDAAQTAFLATQAAPVKVIAEVTAAQSAFLPFQSAALTVVAAGIVADHTAFLATQNATATVLVDIAAANTAFLATQVTSVGVKAKITAASTAFLASQSAQAIVGERPSTPLEGNFRTTVTLGAAFGGDSTLIGEA